MYSQFSNSKCSNYGILYSILLIISTFMIFRTWPILERTWLVQGVIFTITILVSRKFYQTKIFFAIIIYILTVFLNVVTGDDHFNRYIDVLLEFFKFTIPSAITFYILKRGNMKDIKLIISLFYLFVVYTSIISLIINVSFPGVIRDIVAIVNGGGDTSAYNIFFRIGLSNYYLPHCLPVLIPALYLGINNKDLKIKYRVGLLVVWISIILLAYCSGATTALLFSLIFSVVTLFLNPRLNATNNFIRLAIMILIFSPILLNKTFLYDILVYSESFFYDTYFYTKILNLQDMLQYNEISGFAEGRADLYNDSISELGTSLLVGSNEKLGGHSAILDRFASLGIVGFLPFVFIFVLQYKFIVGYISNKSKVFYIYGSLIAFMMLFLKYMLYYEMSVIVLTILPLSIILFEKNKIIV